MKSLKRNARVQWKDHSLLLRPCLQRQVDQQLSASCPWQIFTKMNNLIVIHPSHWMQSNHKTLSFNFSISRNLVVSLMTRPEMLEAWLKLLNCFENHNDATKDLDTQRIKQFSNKIRVVLLQKIHHLQLFHTQDRLEFHQGCMINSPVSNVCLQGTDFHQIIETLFNHVEQIAWH